MQHTKKSKTPQGIEPCPDKVRSATTGVFCFFVVAVREKAKPGGTSKSLFLQEKKTPPHPVATLFCHCMEICLGHEAGTRRQTTGFPISPAVPTTVFEWLIPWHPLIHTNDTIPASLMILKAVYPLHFGGTQGSKGNWRFSCQVYSCNVKRQDNLTPPPPTNTPHIY